MKTSIEWLEEYSDIDVDATKLGDILTMTGSKVETIEEKIQNIKEEAIKDQRDLESEFDNYNKDIQSNTKNW